MFMEGEKRSLLPEEKLWAKESRERLEAAWEKLVRVEVNYECNSKEARDAVR
jgi:two-component SAPR family response regulator